MNAEKESKEVLSSTTEAASENDTTLTEKDSCDILSRLSLSDGQCTMASCVGDKCNVPACLPDGNSQCEVNACASTIEDSCAVRHGHQPIDPLHALTTPDSGLDDMSQPDSVSTPKERASPSVQLDPSLRLQLTADLVPQLTSTPIWGSKHPASGDLPPDALSPGPLGARARGADRPQTLSVRMLSAEGPETNDEGNTSFASQASGQTTTTHGSQTDLDLYDQMQVPIVGYETMEERSRFTVYKMRVQKSQEEGWHIFRRYSDFVRLNDTVPSDDDLDEGSAFDIFNLPTTTGNEVVFPLPMPSTYTTYRKDLKQVFPHFRLALPPKKWFGDNYDRNFLEDRILGLQAFLNNVVSHRDVCNSEAVRLFLCIDDPPGPYDSLEETRAACEMLEDQVYSLRQDLQTRDSRIALLEEELSLYKAELDNLQRALRIERSLNTHRRSSPSSHSQRSEGSITEHDEASEAEADQGQQSDKPGVTSSSVASPGAASTCSWDIASQSSQENIKLTKPVSLELPDKTPLGNGALMTA